MSDARIFKIETDANCKSFLQIEKTLSGSYVIRFLHVSIDFDFMSIVVEMLQDYGDLFAAYVNNIGSTLPLDEAKELVTNFPTTIKETSSLVAKTGEFSPDPDWKISGVGSLCLKTLDYEADNFIFPGHFVEFSITADVSSKEAYS